MKIVVCNLFLSADIFITIRNDKEEHLKYLFPHLPRRASQYLLLRKELFRILQFTRNVTRPSTPGQINCALSLNSYRIPEKFRNEDINISNEE